MPDVFPKGAVIRRVNIEPALLFGAGRALLMQLAHPDVAQGVADHSDFKRNPFTRLQGTAEATYAAVFGSRDLADGVGRRVRWIHDHVIGTTYAANDPANLLWVHATLVDTALRCYTELVAPLTPNEECAYYEEMTQVAALFGLSREDQPEDMSAFRRYVDDTVASFEVTDVARDLASFILRPELPLQAHVPLAPALELHRIFTKGLMPPALRGGFGIRWNDSDDRAFRLARTAVRAAFAVTPRPLRIAPNALGGPLLLRQARRQVRAFEQRLEERRFGTGTAA